VAAVARLATLAPVTIVTPDELVEPLGRRLVAAAGGR